MPDVLTDEHIPVSWKRGSYTGMIGGIDADLASRPVVEVADFGLLNDIGTASNESVLQAAYAGNAGARFVFPEGRFWIRGGDVPGILEGAGLNDTEILTEKAIGFGKDPDFIRATGNSHGEVVGGFTRGSLSLEVVKDSTSYNSFKANRMCYVRIPNNYNVDLTEPTFGWGGGDYLRAFVSFITSVTGTVDNPIIHLDPNYPVPANFVYQPGVPVQIFAAENPPDGGNRGLKSLTVNLNNNDQYCLDVRWALKCYVKDVGFKGMQNYAIGLLGTLGFEIDGCFITGPETGLRGSSKAGIIMDNVRGAYVTNTTIRKIFPHVEINHSTNCTVFKRNLCVDTVLGLTMDDCHGAHNYCNHWFQNIIFGTRASDGYFGTVSKHSFKDNWFPCVNNDQDGPGAFDSNTRPTGEYVTCKGFVDKRGARKMASIDNVFGTPGYSQVATEDSLMDFGGPYMGSGDFYGYQSLLGVGGNSPWRDWFIPPPKQWYNATIVSRSNYDFNIQYPIGGYRDAVVEMASDADAADMADHMTHGGTIGSPYGIVTYVSVIGRIVTFTAYGGNLQTGWGEPGTIVHFAPTSYGFSEKDLDVRATALIRGSKLYDGTAFSDAYGPGETSSDSYLEDGETQLFVAGDLSTLRLDAIEAGQKYLNWQATGRYETATVPRVAAPVFSPAPSTYTSTQSVAITCATDGAVIHYTTDGSTPTAASPVYSSPVSIPATMQLKAIAIDGILLNSFVRGGLYTINLPVSAGNSAALARRR
jgi:hypothetical protein